MGLAAPQPPAAGAGEIEVRHLVDVAHQLDVEPALRGSHHQVGASEAQGLKQHDLGFQAIALFAQQVFSGDAEVDLPVPQRRRDIGGRQQPHLHAGQALQIG